MRFARTRIAEDQVTDTLHESFAIAWKRFDEYLATPTPNWFYAILRNQLRIQRKKYGPVHDSFDEERHALRTNSNPESILLLSEKKSHLHEAINSLPDRYAVVVRLRLEGYKYEKIANLLNLSHAATKSRMRRAIVRLSTAFRSYLQGEDLG